MSTSGTIGSIILGLILGFVTYFALLAQVGQVIAIILGVVVAALIFAGTTGWTFPRRG